MLNSGQSFISKTNIQDIDKKKFKEDQDYPAGGYGGEVLEQGPVKLIAAEELKGTGLMVKG